MDERMVQALPGGDLVLRLASPADFIPVKPGWQERSPFVAQEGRSRSGTSIPTHRRWPRSSGARRPAV